MSPNEPRATCHARRFRHYLMIGIAQVALSQGTPSLAAAEDAPRQSAEIKSFHIPAQPLSSALAAFGQQSGRQTSYDPAIARNVQTSGVSGAMTPEAAISSLLNGTPVQFHRLNAHTLVLERKNATNITLGPVRVGGTVAHQDPTGPGVGYVAENTMAATKTDTPLTEIPNSIFVITKQQMIDQQPQSIQDALKYTPGVYAGAQGTWNNGAAAGNVNGYSQRGFRTRQFVDGIMSESLSSGEPAFLERIEAINGPASVMYGQVTPGGMIASTLKKPTSTPLHQVSVGLGNWGRYEATADVSDKVTQSGNVRYRVAAIGVTQGTQTEHVGYHRVGVLPSLTWDIDPDTSLTVLGSYMYTPGSGVSAGNTYPLQGTLITDGYARIPRKNFLSMTNWNTNSQTDAMFEYQFQHRFNQYINLSQSFRWEKSKELDKDAYYDGYSDGTVYEAPQLSAESTRTVGLDTRLFGKFSTGPFRHTWVVGSDFRDYHYVYPWTLDEREDVAINIYTPQTSYSPCFSSVPSAKCLGDHSLARDDYFQEGVYFQDQIKWKRLSVLLGGRQDWVNYNAHSQDHYYDNTSATSVNTYSTNSTAPQPQSAFTWRAGLLYNFDFGLTPYFSYSTSFVPQQSTNWQGQPFAPLTGKQLEAGLKYKVPNKDILLTAAAYHIDEDHYLISDAVHTGYSADAGRVRSQGFELSANANITHDLRMIASYSYTDIRYANTNKSSKRFDPYTNASYGTAISQSGMTVPYVPRNMVSAFLDYSFPKAVLDGFGINGGVRYVGFTYIDNVESFKTPAYVLFDIGAHYDLGRASPVLKGLKAQLAISNLTNKYYLASCSTYQCYIGQGRRVYGNLTYSW